jgi:hypothetical protein
MSNTTSFNVSLSKFVDSLGSAEPADVYYVAVFAGNPIPPATTAITLTTPISFTTGAESPLWVRVQNLQLPVAPGVNLEAYAGQQLYIMFYNFSNTGCNPFSPETTCHSTTYLFDDIEMSVCTQQPVPSPVTTHIRGDLTLKYLNGTTEKIAGIKVWAYAEGGQTYQTVSIQDGRFDFYNLPAAATGTKYFIYAEHHVTNPLNGVVETLVDNTSVILKPGPSIDTRLTLETLFNK